MKHEEPILRRATPHGPRQQETAKALGHSRKAAAKSLMLRGSDRTGVRGERLYEIALGRPHRWTSAGHNA